MIHKFKIVIFGLVIVLTSCQKVIDIDLKSNDPEIMIEGIVTDDPTIPQTVKITKSVNFSADNVFPTVSGANVVMSDNVGNNVTLTEISPGVYQTTILAGVQGRTYFLSVQVDGKTYTSLSTMPLKVNLDTVKVESGFGLSGSNIVTPNFTDPVGKGNYYRFKLWNNQKVSTGIFLADDQISDGGEINSSLFDQSLEFKTGDTAIVTMMCIDKPVHLYFYSLNQSGSGPDASATPANPVTNIEGATLGYFSAQTTQTKKTVVQ